MKKIIKILISGITAIMAIAGFANVAFAGPVPLSVTFSATPLFSEANFLPGNEVIRTVGVSNNSGATQNVIVEAVNAANTDGLGNKLNLVIKEGNIPLYTGTLGAFLSAGEISLSSLLSGSSTVYSFGVTFVSDAGNDLQNKTLGFDLCIGFNGGMMNCGTEISGEGNTGGGGASGARGTVLGTGGGSSGGSHQLIIFNEQTASIDSVNGSAVITWNTNLLATSQVIYGLSSGSPYFFNINNTPSFGYPFVNVEDLTKTVKHSMLLTGLVPGQTYKYRVVSRASPPTISYEHQFTVPVSSQTGGGISEAVSGPLGISRGEILGANSENNNASSTTSASTSNENNLAAVFAAGWSGLLSWWWLLIVLILMIYLIWRFVFKSRNEEI
jgi:hypothetical protein